MIVPRGRFANFTNLVHAVRLATGDNPRMPYVTQERRDALRTGFAETPGDLNYAVTCLIVDYVHTHGLSYQTINDVLGALDGAGREFYRRVAAPYEDAAIARNGDVYP